MSFSQKVKYFVLSWISPRTEKLIIKWYAIYHTTQKTSKPSQMKEKAFKPFLPIHFLLGFAMCLRLFSLMYASFVLVRELSCCSTIALLKSSKQSFSASFSFSVSTYNRQSKVKSRRHFRHILPCWSLFRRHSHFPAKPSLNTALQLVWFICRFGREVRVACGLACAIRFYFGGEWWAWWLARWFS